MEVHFGFSEIMKNKPLITKYKVQIAFKPKNGVAYEKRVSKFTIKYFL